MAAATHSINVFRRGDFPRNGTYSIAANTLIMKGWLVCLNASSEAVPAASADGFDACGVADSSYDNRTTSPEGGAAGAVVAEVSSGVFELDYNGTRPKAGQVVYVYDNHTVTLDSNAGARGLAGMASDSRTVGKVDVWTGPAVLGLIRMSATYVTRLETAEGDIDDLVATAIATKRIPIPLLTLTKAGAPLVAWSDGATTGLEYTDGEALGIRYNPSDAANLVGSIPLPADLDATEDVTIHVLACRIGAADTTAALDGKAFFQVAGAAYDADADAITIDSAALDSATKVDKELVLTIAAADLPATVDASLTFEFGPTAALDADDMIIHAVWIEYTPAITSA